MNLVRVLESCDRRAESQYGWADFAPVGLMVFHDGSVEAIAGYRLGTTVDQVGGLLVRAAMEQRAEVAALGLVCSAWSSVQAVEAMIDPSGAQDRRRARVVAAVDRRYLLHLMSNIEGSVNYTTDPSPFGGVGQVLTVAMHRLLAEHGRLRRGGGRRRL